MKTKIVNYAYPTSSNAARFGFGRVGCWVVETITRTPVIQPPKALAGFPTEDAAISHANSLPLEWDRLYTKGGAR